MYIPSIIFIKLATWYRGRKKREKNFHSVDSLFSRKALQSAARIYIEESCLYAT